MLAATPISRALTDGQILTDYYGGAGDFNATAHNEPYLFYRRWKRSCRGKTLGGGIRKYGGRDGEVERY